MNDSRLPAGRVPARLPRPRWLWLLAALAWLLPAPQPATAGEPAVGTKPAAATEPAAGVPLGDWQELVFTASKWGLDSRSVVRRERLEGGYWRLTIETSYLSRTSASAVTFDARGVARESLSWRRSGRSSYWNRRLYAADGIHRWRRAPADKAEAEREPGEWSQTEERVEPYPPEIEQCSGVTETEVLLHLLSVPGADLSALCFLSGGEAFQIAVAEDPEAVELEDFAPVLTRVSADGDAGATPLRMQPRARRLGLQARPLSGTSASLRLLGLKGDLTIFLGSATSWPLRLEGRVPWVGKVGVTLVEAWF
jgi:hypothetical protein